MRVLERLRKSEELDRAYPDAFGVDGPARGLVRLVVVLLLVRNRFAEKSEEEHDHSHNVLRLGVSR